MQSLPKTPGTVWWYFPLHDRHPRQVEILMRLLHQKVVIEDPVAGGPTDVSEYDLYPTFREAQERLVKSIEFGIGGREEDVRRGRVEIKRLREEARSIRRMRKPQVQKARSRSSRRSSPRASG